MQAKDIMSPVVIAVPSSLDAELAWQKMRLGRIHHLVVIDAGRIVGVLSDRDLSGERIGKCVADLMQSHVVVVSPEASVRDIAKLLRAYRISCLPVVDGKQLVGIVTTADVLALVGKSSRREDRMPESPATTGVAKT
jgi:CBS domain-containing protein